MTKITWCCTPMKWGYVITASAWVRGRQTRAYLSIPLLLLQNNIPMTDLLAGAVHTLKEGLAEVASMVPATH
jgi:hypothetical protein